MKVGEGGVGFLRRRKAEMGGWGGGGEWVTDGGTGAGDYLLSRRQMVEGHLLTRGGRPEKGSLCG